MGLAEYIKNNDTICLARAIVTAFANLKPECWTKTQVQDGFNKSRKLQKDQALKFHEDTDIEINDYGNDLNDVNKFANYLKIEINIVDSEQFNEIIYTANKGCEDKIYLYKTRNHFDVIKSMTAFYVSYYCHKCKKSYTKRDRQKCPSKCLSCFTFNKDEKCDGKVIICEKCNRKFFGEKRFENHLKNRSKKENKSDIVCDSVKKCLKCKEIITGKYVNNHKCGYKECSNSGKYANKNHKCYLKKKLKDGYCMINKDMPCRINNSIKKKIGVFHVIHTPKNIFFTISNVYKILEPMKLT